VVQQSFIRLQQLRAESRLSLHMTPKMKKLLHAAIVALGITSICLLWLIAPLTTSAHSAVYHWSGSPFQLFVPPVLDFCASWLLLMLVLLLVSGRGRIALWSAMVGFAPWIAIRNWSYLTDGTVPHWVRYTLFTVGLVVLLLSLTLRRSVFEKQFERGVRFASVLFLYSAISGVFILCQYAWFGWQARSLNVEFPLHHATPGQWMRAGRPRVIWILFDELSYQQVYERRIQGLQLSSFDALATQSTVFTHTIPAGILTVQVLPSLMTGQPLDDIHSSPDGRQVFLHNSYNGAWQQFDEHDTVFQDALKLDYGTAIAGWFNPYCRILPDVLDHCFWTFGLSAQNTMVPGATLRTNMTRPLMQIIGSDLGYRVISSFLQLPKMADLYAQQHISDYVALSAASDRILDDQSNGFALLHLPVPHPGGIYDRTTDTFALRNSSYLDNLALADKLLGHIRSKLEKNGQWDSSTIVIMGDHSWRTKMFWKDSTGWTKEEEIASRGGDFDDRPAYIVKLPEQHTGARIDTPFAALNTRRLLDELLSQKIRSKEDLAAWAKQAEN
jgi:Sulfatase